jgi:AcrR family transcriptional regulator
MSLTLLPGDKTLRRRREILEGAARVFRRQGLHATGMRDIAAELEMHAGNLYYYFRNKQELLAFCQRDALEGLLSRAEAIRQDDLRPDRQLFELIVAHVQLLNEELPGSLAHLEVEAIDSDDRGPILEQRDGYERILRQIIDEGVDEGLFRQVDSKVASLAILGAVNWTVKWFRPGGAATIAEIGTQFAEYLVRGLLVSGVEPRFPPPSELPFIEEARTPSSKRQV